VARGRGLQGPDRIGAPQTSRERVLASAGRAPWRGARCGRERRLGQGGHPRDGVVSDEGQAIPRGRYGPCRGSPPGAGVDGDEAQALTQRALADLGVCGRRWGSVLARQRGEESAQRALSAAMNYGKNSRG